MKKFLKKWLGITAIEKTIAEDEYQLRLRRLIGEAFKEVLEGGTDNGSPGRWYWDTKSTLKTALEKASVVTATRVAEFQVAQRISSEAFIDEIVARIKTKQL